MESIFKERIFCVSYYDYDSGGEVILYHNIILEYHNYMIYEINAINNMASEYYNTNGYSMHTNIIKYNKKNCLNIKICQ